MSARVSVDRDGDGRLLAVKQALDRRDRPALVHEAAVLAFARHPGVVEARGMRELGGTLQLLTSWVGSRSLADQPGRSPGELAGIIAAVAETVADLHDLGVVHGQLDDPTHVLIDRAGHPVLCGFGRAEIIGTTGSHGANRAGDVRDLGALITRVVQIDPAEPIVPLRRFGATRRHEGDLARALLTLADHAAADDPTCRPTARALARALQQLAPGRPQPDRQPTPSAPTPPPRPTGADPLEHLRAAAPRPTSSRYRARILRAASALAGVTGVVALALGVFSGGTASPPHATATGIDASVSNEPVSNEPVSNEPVSDLPVPDAPTTDGDRLRPGTTPSNPPASPGRESDQPAPTADPPVVTVEGRRYEIGAPGDEVLVGDWGCDGRLRAALLRPATGEVFVFDGWAQEGAELEARPLTQLAPGAHLQTVAEGDCPRLAGVLADGRVIPLPPVVR
ncbi:MAG: hypothetical protein WHS89_03495 [Acidimicrobiales bacterium]